MVGGGVLQATEGRRGWPGSRQATADKQLDTGTKRRRRCKGRVEGEGYI